MVEGSRGGGEDQGGVRRRGEGGSHVWYREVEGGGRGPKVLRGGMKEGDMDGGGK